MHTILKGGKKSHLGLVYSPEACAALVLGNTADEKPPRSPERFQIDRNETQYQIAQQKQEHAEATRVL